MSFPIWRKFFTPSRLIAILGLASVACAVLIANVSIGEGRTGPALELWASRLIFVHDIVAMTDEAKAALRQYELTQRPEDKRAFLATCDAMALKVNHLRQAEHMSEEQSDQIIDLCISIRQELSKLGSSSADRMSEAGFQLDRIRRVVLGFGIEELRDQEEKLATQARGAEVSRRMSVGMAAIEVLLVAAIVFLVVRLARLEQLATVCGGSHRLLYNGKWVSLESYLEKKFGIHASDGITPEQASRLLAEDGTSGQELLRLIEFEKLACERAREASRAIHAVRNHLTAVLCYSEMAGNGDTEAKREMAGRVLTHANTISTEVDLLHKVVRDFNPPDLHVVPRPGEAAA